MKKIKNDNYSYKIVVIKIIIVIITFIIMAKRCQIIIPKNGPECLNPLAVKSHHQWPKYRKAKLLKVKYQWKYSGFFALNRLRFGSGALSLTDDCVRPSTNPEPEQRAWALPSSNPALDGAKLQTSILSSTRVTQSKRKLKMPNNSKTRPFYSLSR